MSRVKLLTVALALGTVVATFTVGPYLELVERLGGTQPFDEVPAESAEEVAAVLAGLGSEGRELYGKHLTWDLGFLLATSALLFVLLVGALPRTRRSRVVAGLLAVAPGALDVVENLAIARFLAAWQAPPEGWVTVAVLVTPAKQLVLVGAVLTIALAWTWRGLRSLRSVRPATYVRSEPRP